MMLFWLICALLIMIAFAFVLPTALQRNDKARRAIADERKLANIAIYRDQLSELEADLKNGIVSHEQYALDRDEIERRLLDDTAGAAPPTRKGGAATAPAASRGTAYAIAFTLPLAAVIFYWQIGNPDGITGTPRVLAPPPVASTGEPSEAQIEARVAKLAERLKTNPNDADGWKMLARSYTEMSRFGEAAGAYAKATELRPDDADLWADYAYVSALASGRRLEGQPMELINHALKLDPENMKALELAGLAAFQSKNYTKAVEYWERVMTKIPPDSEVGQTIQGRIKEAKTLAAGTK
jgi:cytochrome c-type biogenesis protein CcmH